VQDAGNKKDCPGSRGNRALAIARLDALVQEQLLTFFV
jgi:hypothetical protein